MFRSLELKKANKWLLHIIIIGAAIGSANYFRGAFGSNLLQAMVINTVTSLGIGYPLIVLIYNESLITGKSKSKIARWLLLMLCFIIIAFLGTELERFISSKLLNLYPYIFLGGGSAYFLNVVITAILGFSMSYWINLSTHSSAENRLQKDKDLKANESLPIKVGRKVEFVKLADIVLLEAADNYAYLYDVNGNKKLCDHSLGFLENKIGANFCRVHRKFIINTSHIQTISHYNKRSYAIQLRHLPDQTIKSGETYLDTIKKITKL